MALDPITIGMMTVILTLLMSGMLALTRLNPHHTVGVGYWSMGELSFGAGMLLNLMQNANVPWLTYVAGPLLSCGGMALLIVGILVFKRQKINPWLFPGYLAVVLAAAILTGIIVPNPALRTFALALLFAVPAAYGAKLLLVRISQPLRTPYWLTGTFFLLIVLTMLARASAAIYTRATFLPFAPGLVNQMTLIALCISFLVISYCFLLLAHFRMAIDLEKLASVDSLTGALTRRSLGEQAAKLAKRRGQHSVGIIMLDIDFFKAINDRYGHQAGDKVLQHLAATSQGVLRGVDYFSRVGGEEFCALLTDSDENMTAIVAERIREACAKSHVTYRGQRILYTTSAGVSSGNPAESTFEKMIGEADQALYLAKSTGRNRVVRWSNLHEMVDTETFAKAQIPDQHYSFTASNFRSPDDPEY